MVKDNWFDTVAGAMIDRGYFTLACEFSLLRVLPASFAIAFLDKQFPMEVSWGDISALEVPRLIREWPFCVAVVA